MEDIIINEDTIPLIREYMEMSALNSSDICSLSYRKIMSKRYGEGVLLLNEAIKLYPNELRLWNNRSVCFCELGLYIPALKDGQEMAVRFPGEIKSYYRMAEAYRGLERYKEALVCYQEVLQRDRLCADAAVKLREMQNMTNYSEEQQAQALGSAVPSPSEIGGDVYYSDEEEEEWRAVGPVGAKSSDSSEGAIEIPVPEDTRPLTYSRAAAVKVSATTTKPVPRVVPKPVPRVVKPSTSENSYVIRTCTPDPKDPCTDPENPLQAKSIWIGNVYKHIEKDMLYPYFQKIGHIVNIMVYHEQTCAFVNFENARAAGRAMRELQGMTVNGTKLVLRYPDRFVGKPTPVAKKTFTTKKFNKN